MSRRIPASAIVAAIAAIATQAAPAHQTAKHKRPAHMLVIAQEWSLTLSRGTVPHGVLSVELYDRGQDAHNLNIRHLRRGHPFGAAQHVSLTQSGDVTKAGWHLRPGRYILYCSLPGHEHRGMKAFLVVH